VGHNGQITGQTSIPHERQMAIREAPSFYNQKDNGPPERHVHNRNKRAGARAEDEDAHEAGHAQNGADYEGDKRSCDQKERKHDLLDERLFVVLVQGVGYVL